MGKRRITKKFARKQARHNKALAAESYEEPEGPRSFIIHQGKIGSGVKNLVADFRDVMKPYTAERLVTKKSNVLKDFVSMAGAYKVSHMMIFSQTESGVNLKISRLPQGPTLCFRVMDYCLRKDIISSQKVQMADRRHALYAPCFMTNLQHSEGENHFQLCSQMFLNMFPTIAPSRVKTSTIKRCCLVHHEKEDDTFNIRHYAIKLRPAGISKGTRKILAGKVPNLGSYTEMSDFLERGDHSGSEAEDDPAKEVTVNKKRKYGMARQKSVVKLFELGPRLTLKLIKIQEGLCSGPVLYHSLYQLSNEDKLRIRAENEQKMKLKRTRQKHQEKNIELKKKQKEEHRRQCLEGMGIEPCLPPSKRKRTAAGDDDDEDDDAEYFRQEVGEEPDEDLFKGSKKADHKSQKYKKRKEK